MVRFDLGSLLQGQMRVAKLKSAYSSLIIGLEVWDGKPTYRKSWAGNLLVWSDLTLVSTYLLLKNAAYLLNYVSWPFPVDASGHRCVLGLVYYMTLYCIYPIQL